MAEAACKPSGAMTMDGVAENRRLKPGWQQVKFGDVVWPALGAKTIKLMHQSVSVTELFMEVQTDQTPKMVERIVNDIFASTTDLGRRLYVV